MRPGDAVRLRELSRLALLLGLSWAAPGAMVVGAMAGRAAAQEFVGHGRAWADGLLPAALEPQQLHDFLGDAGVQQYYGLALDPKLSIGPFVRTEVKRDTRGLSYNNWWRLGPGVQLTYSPVDWVAISAGELNEAEYRFVEHRWFFAPVGFVNWWGERTWEPESAHDLAPIGYQVNSWGELRYPSGHLGVEQSDLLLDGELRADQDWWKIAQTIRFATKLTIDYSVDTRRLDYYNKLVPAAGIALKAALEKAGSFEASLQYGIDYRPRSGNAYTGPLFALSWSLDW